MCPNAIIQFNKLSLRELGFRRLGKGLYYQMKVTANNSFIFIIFIVGRNTKSCPNIEISILLNAKFKCIISNH